MVQTLNWTVVHFIDVVGIETVVDFRSVVVES